MPRTIETTVYTIDELSDRARETARSWYREAGLHDEWYDFVYEDFQAICRILGVDLGTSPVKLMGGGTRDLPQAYFPDSTAKAMAPASLAHTATPGARRRPFAPTRRRTRSCTGSRTNSRRFNGRTSGNSMPPSGSAGATATSTR